MKNMDKFPVLVDLTFLLGMIYVNQKSTNKYIIFNCSKCSKGKEHGPKTAYNKGICSRLERSENDFWGSVSAKICRMSRIDNLDSTSEICFFSWLMEMEFGASKSVFFKLQVEWNPFFFFFLINYMDPDQHLFPNTIEWNGQDRSRNEWNFRIALLEIIVLWSYVKCISYCESV